MIDNSWKPILNVLYQEPLLSLKENILTNISYAPKKENVFKVFEKRVEDIKVVILGQDPYFTPNVAIGRAFAISEETKIPASLRNIQKEIKDSEAPLSDVSDTLWKTLEHWESQGVFLLNTALTVEIGKPGSHIDYWKGFTESVIKYLSYKNPCIWILWGKVAQKYKGLISKPFEVKNYKIEQIEDLPMTGYYNYILEAPHPAAESYAAGRAGFYGCNHFNLVNSILEKKKLTPIKW